jgi:GntR family transcriptional regulator
MLDNHSPLPLYHQLRKMIVDRIETGEWRPGDRVPSEVELVKQYGVSRTTVRLALADLANQGLLTRLQGRGTFVAQPHIRQHLNRLTGFTQDMQSRGKHATSRLLRFEVVSASQAMARVLDQAPGVSLIVLKRLRLADELPMAIETSYLVYELCQALLKQDLTSRSLYHLLSVELDINPARAHQEMQAVVCPPEEARLLGVPRSSPVLHIIRTTYDQKDRPFEHVESYYRGDRYVFQAELRWEPSQILSQNLESTSEA